MPDYLLVLEDLRDREEGKSKLEADICVNSIHVTYIHTK